VPAFYAVPAVRGALKKNVATGETGGGTGIRTLSTVVIGCDCEELRPDRRQPDDARKGDQRRAPRHYQAGRCLPRGGGPDLQLQLGRGHGRDPQGRRDRRHLDQGRRAAGRHRRCPDGGLAVLVAQMPTASTISGGSVNPTTPVNSASLTFGFFLRDMLVRALSHPLVSSCHPPSGISLGYPNWHPNWHPTGWYGVRWSEMGWSERIP